MAIVKMSEFKLLVRNEAVDSLLKSLHSYKDIVFSEIKGEFNGFEAYPKDYDFDLNRQYQEQIQAILKKASTIKKTSKDSKDSIIDKLALQHMDYANLEKLMDTTDLNTLLSKYSKHYDQREIYIYDFKLETPNYTEMSNDELTEVRDNKAVIGRLEAQKVQGFVAELKRQVKVFYMTSKVDNDYYFVIKAPQELQEVVGIICERYDFEIRSSTSLKITDEVQKMQDAIATLINNCLHYESNINDIGNDQDLFKAHFEGLRNEALREESKLHFLQSNYVTLIHGWVTTNDVEKVLNVLNEELDGVLDVEFNDAPLHSTDVPIKLKNNKFVTAFESITNMYSQPRYDEPDPTPILSFFYAMFFGMMLGDIGYGLIMALITFVALKFINLKPGTKGMLSLLFYVSFPTMFWGFIYGSFFGDMIPMTPIIDINSNYTFVLVMAIGFGLIHIFSGLAMKAYIYIRDYKIRYVLYDVIFWYMTLIGLVVLVTQMFTPIFAAYNQIALYVMIIGMVGIVLTNGREAKTIGGKIVSGLYSLYGLSNYIGDVVSYSRLMALGLAGASIGVAFNMMVRMTDGMGIFGIIFGAIIFMIGHGFNLLISGMSAYVHTARLTYVEFFGKFFTGGGKPFKQFIASPTYITIEEEK